IEITCQTVEQMVAEIMSYPEKSRLQVLAPVVSGRKGEHVKLLNDLQKEGYVRLIGNGETYDISEEFNLDINKIHSIEDVIDRIILKEGVESRLADSLESALPLGEGRVIIDFMGESELLFNENHACPICGFSIDELEPRLFSFNSPFGACPTCDG